MTLLTVGTSVLGQVAQFSAASQQAAEQDRIREENRQNALAANRQEQKQMNLRAMQEADALAEKQRVGKLEGEKAASFEKAAAAEGNVAGLSVDSLIADIRRTEANNQMLRDINYENTVAQISEEKRGSGIRTVSRINSVPPGTRPNPLTLVAGIGSTLVKGYQDYKAMRPT